MLPVGVILQDVVSCQSLTLQRALSVTTLHNFKRLALCEENPLVTSGLPSKRPVTWSYDAFFDLCLNKWLRKQSRCRWFEKPLHSSCHHCSDIFYNSGILLYWILSQQNKLQHTQANICRSKLFTSHHIEKATWLDEIKMAYVYEMACKKKNLFALIYLM